MNNTVIQLTNDLQFRVSVVNPNCSTVSLILSVFNQKIHLLTKHNTTRQEKSLITINDIHNECISQLSKRALSTRGDKWFIQYKTSIIYKKLGFMDECLSFFRING